MVERRARKREPTGGSRWVHMDCQDVLRRSWLASTAGAEETGKPLTGPEEDSGENSAKVARKA